MSYGAQLNIFRAGSNKFGPDWRAIIIVSNGSELHIAADDAREALGGRYSHAAQTLFLPTGAKLSFRIITHRHDAEKAFKGCSFTQIAFLHRPEQEVIREMARAALRSQAVPNNELRYEYLNVR